MKATKMLWMNSSLSSSFPGDKTRQIKETFRLEERSASEDVDLGEEGSAVRWSAMLFLLLLAVLSISRWMVLTSNIFLSAVRVISASSFRFGSDFHVSIRYCFTEAVFFDVISSCNINPTECKKRVTPNS